MSKPQIVLELPSEREIESVEERKLLSGVLKRTVRYRSGLIMVFHQDFRNCVFSLEMKSDSAPLWLSQNQLYVLETPPDCKRKRYKE